MTTLKTRIFSRAVAPVAFAALSTVSTFAASSTSATHDTAEVVADTKAKVEALLNAVNDYDANKGRELLHPDYIQHNPFIPTGSEALLGLLPVLKEHSTQVNTIRLLRDGNYVVAHNLWENATPFGAPSVVTFDIFRIDQDGYIAEHWDAIMPDTPPNPSGRTLTDGATDITDLDRTEANKTIATGIFETIVNGSPDEVGAMVMKNFLPDYLQHNPKVADGIPAVFDAFQAEAWVYQKTHKILGEGNFVLAVSEGTAKGVHSAFYDLLRFEDGKVAEHWDVIQAIPSEGLANDNGMFGFQ